MGTKLGSFLREAGHTKQRIFDEAAVKHVGAVGEKAPGRVVLAIILDVSEGVVGHSSVFISTPSEFPGQAEETFRMAIDVLEREYAEGCLEETDTSQEQNDDEIPDYDWELEPV